MEFYNLEIVEPTVDDIEEFLLAMDDPRNFKCNGMRLENLGDVFIVYAESGELQSELDVVVSEMIADEAFLMETASWASQIRE